MSRLHSLQNCLDILLASESICQSVIFPYGNILTYNSFVWTFWKKKVYLRASVSIFGEDHIVL